MNKEIHIWKTSNGHMMISWVKQQTAVIDNSDHSIKWYASEIGVNEQIIRDAYKIAEEKEKRDSRCNSLIAEMGA
jgi:hypothetical protein